MRFFSNLVFTYQVPQRHARILGLRSTQLAVAIEEEAQGLEGAKLQERTDEVTM